MTFLDRFRTAWVFARFSGYEPDPDWTDVDARSLEGYFNSETGRKLKSMLNNMVFRRCYEATTKEKNLKFHCGVARGTSLTVFELQQLYLSRVPAQEDKSEEPDSAAAYLEQLGALPTDG